MKLDNNEFYVLDCKTEIEIFNTFRESVEALRLSKAEDAEILKFVRDDKGKWLVSSVSWKEIGLVLMCGGENETGT